MEFSIKGGELSQLKTDCVIVGVYASTGTGDARKLSKAAQVLDKAAKGAISVAANNGDISGKVGTTLLLQSVPGVAAQHVCTHSHVCAPSACTRLLHRRTTARSHHACTRIQARSDQQHAEALPMRTGRNWCICSS